MTTVRGMTADRMLEIEAASVVTGEVVGDDLILTTRGGDDINAGNVRGPEGDVGPMGVSVPSGGLAGQTLQKLSDDDYDFMWTTALRSLVVTAQATNYTLTLDDAETVVIEVSGFARVVTVPTHAAVPFPIGTRITVVQGGVGDVSIAAAPGVTLGYPQPLTPNLLGLGAAVELLKLSEDSWVLIGHGNLATSEAGWREYTPTVEATTSNPLLGAGTGAEKHGIYIVDSNKRCIGAATVRWGGTSTQGSGYYKMKLPVLGVNVDNLNYTPIGVVSVGVSTPAHTTGVLHYCGWPGQVSAEWAMGAMNGGLFAADNYPVATKGNIHWQFAYQAANYYPA